VKRYFKKNFDYGEHFKVYRKSLAIQRNLDCSSYKNARSVKTKGFKRAFLNGRFKAYLPDHPEPQ